MEYVVQYMDDPRAGKRPARDESDVISRSRYLGDDYRRHLMREITGVEIAASERDAEQAIPILAAAGFAIRRDPQRVIADDGQTRLTFDTGAAEQAGVRRIDFLLNRDTPRQDLQLGHSVLHMGPGATAEWRFDVLVSDRGAIGADRAGDRVSRQ